MARRNRIIRTVLVVALVAQASALGWVAWTKASTGQGGALLVAFAALLPLLAAGLLALRRDGGGPLSALGGTLAIIAALLGTLVGFVVSSCFYFYCGGQPPLSAEAIALLVLSIVVFALTVADLAAVGLVWVTVGIVVFVLAISGTVGLIAASLIVAGVVAWFIVRPRRRPLRVLDRLT